jgi:hypothetical protein
MACDPLIKDAFEFPRRAANRPGLPRIAYRIGRYPDFVEAMIRRIDAAPELAAWTYRGADDPAIALLEGSAILADILSFYQEHYANEAYLRTAAWRESVAELVRLTGYRLAPGLGGRAMLAFEARGAAPVVIHAGFPVKLDLADGPVPADFQTAAELTAWPHLGRFHLYRPRHYDLVIAGGQAQFELASAGGATDSIALEATELKKGDRLLLLPEENLLALLLQVVLGWKVIDQPAEEIVVVDKVERVRGRVVVTLAGALTHGWLRQCRAYRLGRSFRHFGAAAPLEYVHTNTSADPPLTTATATAFLRDLRNTTAPGPAYTPIAPQAYALEQEVPDLAAGNTVVVTGVVGNLISYALPFAIARTVTAVRAAGPRWGNLAGPSTQVLLDAILAPVWTAGFGAIADLRALRLHETRGPMLRLRPVSAPADGAFVDGSEALCFYGTATEAQVLCGRRLHLAHDDGRSVELTCMNTAADFPPPAVAEAAQMWTLSFDRAPAPFTRADFDEAAPAVTVFGNLVDATQGKAEREAVLGNGDGRERFQTFALPKAPLTYLLHPGATPPQVPELEVRVDGRLWSRVDSLFGRGPKDEIYIVREDAEGRSFVQFGDGETGARLPSGVGNVSAAYRTGVGAQGLLKPGAVPTASERPPGFDKLTLAGIVSGGAQPEDMDKARMAAPGKVQSLGRLVSLSDYETETLALPGVVAAAAAWDLHGGVPAVVVRVLLEAGREAEFADVRAALALAQRCRGPDRFALVVQQAMFRHVFLDLRYAFDPAHRQPEVEAGLRAALGLAGVVADERSGVFGLRARRLGEVEYASRIEGRLQNVAGVLWCNVSALGLFAPWMSGVSALADPALLALPAAPRALATQVDCGAHEFLQLAAAHLTLTAVAAVAAGECT